ASTFFPYTALFRSLFQTDAKSRSMLAFLDTPKGISRHRCLFRGPDASFIARGSSRMALKTIKANGQMQAGMTIDIQCGSHHIIMDQPRAAGGADMGATPLEVMIATVAGCFGSIGRIVAHQQKLTINGMRFEVEADYDPAGLLGRETDARVGFEEI